MIYADYPEKNVEIVEKGFSEATSAEIKFPKSGPEKKPMPHRNCT